MQRQLPGSETVPAWEVASLMTRKMTFTEVFKTWRSVTSARAMVIFSSYIRWCLLYSPEVSVVGGAQSVLTANQYAFGSDCTGAPEMTFALPGSKTCMLSEDDYTNDDKTSQYQMMYCTNK
jgi:hypothetical protein